MIQLVKTATAKTSDFARLTTGASILTAFAFDGEHEKDAWTELLVLLVIEFPLIRKQTAEVIYEKLLFQDETATTTALSQVLLETAWDGPLETVMERREQLCQILKIQAPQRKRKSRSKTSKITSTTEDHISYETLVDDYARGI